MSGRRKTSMNIFLFSHPSEHGVVCERTIEQLKKDQELMVKGYKQEATMIQDLLEETLQVLPYESIVNLN